MQWLKAKNHTVMNTIKKSTIAHCTTCGHPRHSCLCSDQELEDAKYDEFYDPDNYHPEPGQQAGKLSHNPVKKG